ncbi:MAG: hypothetical protein Q7R93_00280 [bacterium]|nr:hypothetical protein [bacterium]
MDDVKWFIGLIVLMGILWLGARMQKGEVAPAATSTAPSTQGSQTLLPGQRNPAVRDDVPLSPQNGGRQGTVTSQTPIVPTNPNLSPLSGRLGIVSINQSTAVDQEYVVIQASPENTGSVPITGLTIQSVVSFNKQSIPRGWTLIFPPTMTGGGDLVSLKPGERAYLISGHSPFGGSAGFPGIQNSFQLNLCTGYFEQGTSFSPGLPLQCPRPTDDPLPLPPNALSDDCYDYLSSIPTCMVPSPIPVYLDGSCQAHVTSRINYGQCVKYYKDSPDFYQGEWHLYLGRSTPMWRDRKEAIQLVDANGKIISSYTY